MQLKGQGWDRLNVCLGIREKLNVLKIKKRYVTILFNE